MRYKQCNFQQIERRNTLLLGGTKIQISIIKERDRFLIQEKKVPATMDKYMLPCKFGLMQLIPT